MNIFWLKFVFGLFFLMFASYKDFKSREVWDWLSFSFISFGFLLNLFFSIYEHTSFYIISSLLGFGIAFGLSLLLFYLGQWGGGDAKLLMGLGSLLGVNLTFSLKEQIFFLLGFIFSLILTAWVYALVLILIIYFRNKDYLNKKIKGSSTKKNKVLYLTEMFLALVFIILILSVSVMIKDLTFFLLFLALSLLLLLLRNLMNFLRIIEHFGFVTSKSVKELTPGDWVVEKGVINNPGLSFFDYELLVKHNNFENISFVYQLFFRMLHPRTNLKEYLKQKLKKKLLKKMKTSDESLLEITHKKKSLPNSIKEFIKQEGFLIDSNEIIICAPNSLGLLPKQIELLREHFGEDYVIKIKEGIPFVPAFFLAFIFQFLVLDKVLAYLPVFWF